jgi:hypothetical protein
MIYDSVVQGFNKGQGDRDLDHRRGAASVDTAGARSLERSSRATRGRGPRDVAVVGAGRTSFGAFPDERYPNPFAEASMAARDSVGKGSTQTRWARPSSAR